jgi:hypothetical protein
MDLLKDGPLNPGNILSNFCYSIQNFMEEEDMESIDILAIKMLYKKEVKKLEKEKLQLKHAFALVDGRLEKVNMMLIY